MKSLLLFMLAAGLLFFAALPVRGQQLDTARENRLIRQLVQNYEDAWNRHDAKALASNYRTDATWVNWFGAYYSGRQDIENHYRTTHDTYFKPSHYYTRKIEDIGYLHRDVAIAHVRTGLTDDARYPAEVFEFRRMIVLTKKDGVWLIQAGQNAKLEKGVK
jgi:uncharacterized protein (TIGR02246 family)